MKNQSSRCANNKAILENSYWELKFIDFERIAHSIVF